MENRIMGTLMSAASMLAGGAMAPFVAPPSKHLPPEPRRGGRTKKNGAASPNAGAVTIGQFSSLRKRMRAVNRGLLSAPQPTKSELMRYPWYRRKVAWAKVRVRLGQEQPGDRQLAA